MHASRLLTILMLLQSRGRISAPVLAAELEVTPRTVLRDMEQLSAAGVPIWAERGRDGGFQLQAGWSTKLTGLTTDEAQAMLLAGIPSAATELGLGSASISARLKMLASVPISLREDAHRVSSRLHIDPAQWYQRSAAPAHLSLIANAVWNQHPLRFSYDSWRALARHRVTPLGLVLKAGNWYLFALPFVSKSRTSDNNTPRTFRLSNMTSVTVDREVFKYPKHFDLALAWERTTRRFEQGIYTGTARLLVTKGGLRRLNEISSALLEATRLTRTRRDCPPGWECVEVPIESINHAADQFLGLGLDVEVLAPAELRQQIAGRLAELVSRYAERSNAKPANDSGAHRN